MPRALVYRQRNYERLEDRMVAEGRERELATGCVVRDPKDGSTSRHQDGAWQIRRRHEEISSQKQVRDSRSGKRRETRLARWNACLEGLDDRQSCCNTRRKTSPAQHSVLRHDSGVRACEHRRGRACDSPRGPAGERRVLPVAEGTLLGWLQSGGSDTT